MKKHLDGIFMNVKKNVCILCPILFVLSISVGCSNKDTSSNSAIDSQSENSKQENTIYALTKETWYSDGEKSGEISYVYDESGRLERIDRDVDSIEYYDEEQNLYVYTTSTDGQINKSLLFEYDEKDNIVSRTIVSPQKDSVATSRYDYIYEFDKSGRAIQCNEYYEGEEKDYICKFSWDSSNLVYEELWGYNFDDKTEKTLYCYSYGSEDQVITYDSLEIEAPVSFSITYNNKGKVAKIIVLDKGSNEVVGVIEYIYDANGGLLYAEESDADGNSFDEEESGVEFKYDEHGNIISIITDYGESFEYEYQQMEFSSECILNGNDIAIIRQQYYTDYYPIYVPGWHHAAHIYQID